MSNSRIDWTLVLGGALMAVLGMVVMAYPGLTLAIIAVMAGIGFIFAGCVDLVFYLQTRNSLDTSVWALLYVVLDIVIGLMFLIHPVAASEVIPWLAGLFIILFGAAEIAASLRVRSSGAGIWGWMMADGVLSILLGILFVFMPASMALFMGAFVLLRGISLIVYGVGGSRMAF